MERYERAPHEACFDGAFSSRANFEEIKRLQVGNVVFTKAKGGRGAGVACGAHVGTAIPILSLYYDGL
jgi:hypothetical protein